MRIIEDIIGKEVINAEAIVIGKIDDIEVDFEEQSLEAIIIKKGGFAKKIAASNSEDVIPFDMIKALGDKVIIKDVDEL